MNRSINAKRAAVVAALLVGGLSACGGGGGGSSSPPASPAVVDSGNAATITREVIEVGLDAGSVGVALSGGVVLSGDGGANAAVLAVVRRKASIQSVQPGVQPGVQPSATIPAETFDCLVSGTIRLSGSIANFDTLTAGDRITADFSNCDEGDGAVYSGRMRIDVTSFTGDLFNDQFALGARVTITNLAYTIDGVRNVGNGVANMDLDILEPFVSTFTVAGDRLELSSGSRSWVLRDFAVSIVDDASGLDLVTENSGSGTLEGHDFSGAVDFLSVAPLVSIGGDYPGTGELLITGANGATIRVTVLDTTTLQLELDFNGDSVVDEIQQMAWSTVGSLGAG